VYLKKECPKEVDINNLPDIIFLVFFWSVVAYVAFLPLLKHSSKHQKKKQGN
jgi:hypothetical protein